jgi:ankyrin repeat protein
MGVNAIHEVVFGATKHAMEIITQFTKLGADCNARTYEGLLPLSIAISRQCRRDVISHLSELAVDAGIINVRDKYGETLVYKAFRNGDFHTMTELAKMMPKNDAWMRPPHVLPQDRGSELFQACHNGSHERASRILLQKPDINAREEIFGRTALHEAVERSRGAFVDLLLSNGAHPFLQDRHGKFPRDLLPAAGRADDPLVAAYLRAGEEQWIVKEFTGASIDRIAEWIEGNGSATQDRTALSLKRSFEKCCPT